MGWMVSLRIQVIKNPEGQGGVFVKRCREKSGMHPWTFGGLELSDGCSFFIRRSSKLLDMDDCANRDVWNGDVFKIYIYISISIVLPAGSSQGKLGRKVTNLPTQSYHFSKFSPTDLIISGFESNFTPVRWMHSLQNCFWFAKKNLLRMRFFDNKKLQIQFFHHFHPLFFGCCWDLPFFSSFSV